MGDPAGVGPEVIAGSWLDAELASATARLVVGDPAVIGRAAKLLRLPLRVEPVSAPETADIPAADCIPVLDIDYGEAAVVPPGVELAEGGEAAVRCVLRAAELALAGQVDAIVTAPLGKRAMHLAGYTQWPGHTEMLAGLCGGPPAAMMLYLSPRCPAIRGAAGLGIVHATLHCSIREALAQLSPGRVLAAVRLAVDFAAEMLRAAGEERLPRIGVAALNPHAGEGGLFGDEERRIIRPAVEAGVADGLPLTGPLPADTLMHRAAGGEFDAVVAMLHDQGHIALKLLGLHQAVNVTLGLPIIRTSVAHGTALDIAWQGIARSSSMAEAIRVACALIDRRPGAAR